MKRKDILQKIIAEQKKVIENLKQSVERYKTASNIDEDSTLDPEDYSHQSEAKDMQLRFEKMLNEAKGNLNFLINERETTHTEIENGALVETDANYLFVGISVPKFKWEDKDIISFSEDTPIYKKIRGKKEKDSFQMGEHLYKIVSIS